MRILLRVLVVSVLSACAPVSQLPVVEDALALEERKKQQDLAVVAQRKNFQRIVSAGYPILKANADLCGEEAVKKPGIYLANKYSFSQDFRAAAERALDLDESVKVYALSEKSPAFEAGLREGDTLVSIGSWGVPIGEKAVLDTKKKLKEIGAEETASAKFKVLREGQDIETLVNFTETCPYNLSLEQKDIVNAYADGTAVVITTGMLRFIESESELEVVLGHEVAHNLMGHISKSQGNRAVGLLVDILFAGFGVNTNGAFSDIGAAAFSQEFEAEADYVGLYLASRAGSDISSAPNFWRRMAVAHPGNIKDNMTASHPAPPRRFVALEKTISEIEAKIETRQPLLPEKKIAPAQAVMTEQDQY